VDLVFPHHENEIAQSEAASGELFCKVWMHGGFLDLEGAKMSKSLGNVKDLRAALAVVDAEALRYFFLSTHYRAQIAFSDKSLADAESRMQYFYETLRKVDDRIAAARDLPPGPIHGQPEAVKQRFIEVMDDDFNFAGGLGVLSELFTNLNELTDKPPVKDKPLVVRTLVELRKIVREVSSVLGLFEDPPAEWLARRRDRLVVQRGIDPARVEALLVERAAARAAKDFKRSDAIRDEAKALGVEIMDTPQGTDWKVA
jgi:cysteinyl-tRNA synthetase